jgi:glucosamine 6-phosphate synthetase-like amidotransferase/phosphosugar isomerase protein
LIIILLISYSPQFQFRFSSLIGKTFVASEPAAFGHHTKNYIPLEDKEIVVLNVDNNTLDVTRIQQNRNEVSLMNSPDPYLHWTIKGKKSMILLYYYFMLILYYYLMILYYTIGY